jgi:hypothetical protein
MAYIERFSHRSQIIRDNTFTELGKRIYEKYLREEAKTEKTLEKALKSSSYFWKLVENEK